MAYEKIALTLLRAYKSLKKAKIDSYILDARILLQYTCNISHEIIISQPNLLVETSFFDRALARRISREPISHILGTREFYGYNFKVTHNTLDPRPDSESLIEVALEYFTNYNKKIKILDLGTGTGCLLLTLLKLYNNATGIGVDISNEAMLVAKENAKNLALDDRASFINGNWADGLNLKFDLIITNPPYIKDEDILDLEEEVRIHEPKIALLGGLDGLDAYRSISYSINKLLKKNTIVIIESGRNQESDIIQIFQQYNLINIAIKKDLAGINRAIVFKSTH